DVVGGVLDGPQVGLEHALLAVVQAWQGARVDGTDELHAGQVLVGTGSRDRAGDGHRRRYLVARVAVPVPVHHELLLQVGRRRATHGEAHVVHRYRLSGAGAAARLE